MTNNTDVIIKYCKWIKKRMVAYSSFCNDLCPNREKKVCNKCPADRFLSYIYNEYNMPIGTYLENISLKEFNMDLIDFIIKDGKL